MDDDSRTTRLRARGGSQAHAATPAAELRRAEDDALMRGIVSRDPGALEKLYDRHAGRLLAICRRILGQRADAEEVLFDLFWEVWSRPERYDSERSRPEAYLAILARSRALDRVRHHSRRVRRERNAPLDREPSTTPLEATIAAERSSGAAVALAQLSPDERTVVELSFFEGLTHREIAEQLDIPLGTIKTRIRRGLLRLRGLLSEQKESG